MSTEKISSWFPIILLTFSAFIFNTTEFTPVALLTDIAADLNITEAKAGLIITIYAWVVLIMSLPLMLIASRIEFKRLLSIIIGVYCLGHIISVFAGSFATLLVARICIALSHCIFWSIAMPLAVKLAPPGKRAAALSLVGAGTAVAMVLGMPLGRIVGLSFGWRAPFALLGIAAFIIIVLLQFIFPKVPVTNRSSLSSLPQIIKNGPLMTLYVITACIFTGHFTGYSFIEPFLLNEAKLHVDLVTVTISLFGISGVAGSFIFSRYSSTSLKQLAYFATFGLAVFLLCLHIASYHYYSTVLICIMWGLAFAVYSLLFQDQVIKLMPEQASIAMSIYSSICNLGIGAGALVGGIVSSKVNLAYIGYAGSVVALAGALICAFFFVKKLIANQ